MTERHKTKKHIKIITICLLVVFLFGYTFYEIHRIIFGPNIQINYPQSGASVSDSLLEITGVAKNIKDITLNGRSILMDENGNFKEKILLSYGYNALDLRASDKFGSNTEKVVEVVYK
jgi:hypothetical protein